MSHVQLPAAAMAGLAATLLLGTFLAGDAQAAGAGHKPRAHNRQVQVESVTKRTDNGRITQSTATRDDGRTATRNTTVVNDRATGTRSVQTTATGFNGGTTSYSSQAQRTDDGYTRDVSRTLPSGQVNERNIDVSCDAALQTCTKTVVGSRGD